MPSIGWENLAHRFYHIRIHQVENDGPDDTDEILDNNFAMIYCKQGRASPEDSDSRDHLRFSYIHQRSSSGDTRHTDNGRDDSSRGCCTSLPTDNHKPAGQLLVVVGRAQVANTPEKHWQPLLPVHTYATSFYFPPYTDSVSPRTVLPHIRKSIGKWDD